MPKISQCCFFLLALFLPVQTIFASFITVKLSLPIWLNLWKEALIVVICIQLGIQILRYFQNQKKLEKSNSIPKLEQLKVLAPLILIVFCTLVVTFNSIIFGEFHSYIYIIGFRFELFWLWFFAIITTWLNTKKNRYDLESFNYFRNNLVKFVFAGFSLVVVFVSAQLLLGQQTVNSFIGFGSESQVEYLVSAPTCHVIDFGQNSCRLAGTFSTPNHMASYLLLILPLFTINLTKKNRSKVAYGLLSLLITCLIFLTAARFAVLGLGVWLLLTITYFLPRRFLRKLLFSSIITIPLVITLFPIYVGFQTKSPIFEIPGQFIPESIAKPSSTVEHYRQTMASLSILTESPTIALTGLGLGNSGPAAKSIYQDLFTDNLLYKKFNYVSYDWYILHYRITIPENWYIQLILNGGIFYALAYIALLTYPVQKLFKGFYTKQVLTFRELQFSLGFLAILIGNLFLHLWENQTVSMYWSILWIAMQDYSVATESQN
ncbi:MAG: hypothetical protein AAGF07_03265 [Patescibacteria group bacterium]